ncbi:hypothetical protein D0962_35765 [Leptolyngbyaceae cyanobacterium CCMR0082]|uniref:Uncharacterized protein n=1 Tax=Adonisia turfae CCMR0082 TaxID=2304604 RepID=A0A6M0SHH6_9CYAN|nr:hypothetical protein [Adonisia turfae]NEZ68030.1 hypothetical protein [Adonisia turfae CCMR0082]
MLTHTDNAPRTIITRNNGILKSNNYWMDEAIVFHHSFQLSDIFLGKFPQENYHSPKEGDVVIK